MLPPRDPLAAVTHPDPYPYYADLVEHRPFERDEALGLWVAASAEAVSAVLASDACRVRPLDEPVPRALLGSPAAEIFRHLVRMNDGVGHCPFKQAVSAALAPMEGDRLAGAAAYWAARLADASPSPSSFMLDLSAHVVGRLVGIPEKHLFDCAAWMADFVHCLSPLNTPRQIETGMDAARNLAALVRTPLARGDDNGLLTSLSREARHIGCADDDVVVANAIGFLSQAYEATAGLIGNTLRRLAGHSGQGASAGMIAEVARWDPPVQNTRRFAASDATIAGRTVRRGEAILVVLAAANRDWRVNPDPARFDANRAVRRGFTFGAGVHACPGEIIATTIARAGIEALLARGWSAPAAALYRPSVNTRIPVFAEHGWEER